MKSLVTTGLACATFLFCAPDAAAHGGTYRGPGDTVPPGGSGGGGSRPGPGGPVTPGSGGPATPGVGGPSSPGGGGPGTGGPPGGGSGSPTSGGGMAIGDDLTKWQFWWEFNKDPFINLREAIQREGVRTNTDEHFMGAGKIDEAKDTRSPTNSQIMNVILPKLKQALDSTGQRDITSSCMVAMAKIGEDHEQFRILEVFRERLVSRDLEIRETAAISMGISQMTEAIEDLVEIANDTAKGRKLTDRASIDDRTRSFATYGLGLVAFGTSNVAAKRRVFEGVKGILTDDSISDRNIRVAAINTIGLLQPAGDKAGRRLLADACAALEGYWNKRTGPGEQIIQSHVPPAIAKLLDACNDGTLRAKYVEDYVNTLQRRTKIKRSKDQIEQSAAVALGRLVEPGHAEHDSVVKALVDYTKNGKDKQTQFFSLMALGQIGSEDARKHLLKALQTGGKSLVKPWAALSLGVMCFRQIESQNASVDTTVGHELHRWLLEVKNPSARSAFAIALGLCKYDNAADDMRGLLEDYENQDELAGYLCIGLALMDDARSKDAIRELVAKSALRPVRLRQAAIALGRLGDGEVALELATMLNGKEQNLARMGALASALGFIGDSRTVQPLTKMMFDDSLTDLTRAFAAVALGGVADKELLPWNSKIGTNMNYRAAVETLTNQQTGILDIL